MNKEKRLAVVIPIYNGERFLKETLESVYAQEYSSFTVLLCDDASTDDSAGVISRTINASSAAVHLITHTENVGPSDSIAELIFKAKEFAEIAIIIGHDDLLPPDYLRTINLEFNDSNTVLVTTSAIQINDLSRRLRTRNSPPFLRFFGKYLPAFLLAANQITAPGVAFRITAFDRKILGTENPNTQDWIQWIYTSLTGQFKLCTKTNVFYRRHAGSMTAKNDVFSAHIEISKSRIDFLASQEFGDFQNSLNFLQRRFFYFLIKFLFLEFSNCSHNAEFKSKLRGELFPGEKVGHSNVLLVESCDLLNVEYTNSALNKSEKNISINKTLNPDSLFTNWLLGIFYTIRILAAGFWHAIVWLKRQVKNRLSQITIYSTGGLGAQLGALSYAIWLQEHFERPIKIQFHEKGLTYYPIVIKELLFGVRYEIIESNTMLNSIEQNLPHKYSILKLISYFQVPLRFFKKFVIWFLMKSRIIISSEHLSIASLRQIRRQTKIVRGYHSDLRVIGDAWELLTRQFPKSSVKNFMIGGGTAETIAIHWRLGDYLTNPHANFTHGTISTDSIVACLRMVSRHFKVSDVRVFSDSPELAKSQLLDYCDEFNFNFEIGDIWMDLFEMSRSKFFIGSHSSISTWAAMSIARTNPRAEVYLPNKWFKNLPLGFETSDEEFLMPQEIFLNMKSYDVTLL